MTRVHGTPFGESDPRVTWRSLSRRGTSAVGQRQFNFDLQTAAYDVRRADCAAVRVDCTLRNGEAELPGSAMILLRLLANGDVTEEQITRVR